MHRLLVLVCLSALACIASCHREEDVCTLLAPSEQATPSQDANTITFRHTFPNISQLTSAVVKQVRSSAHPLRGVAWQLELMPHVTKGDRKRKTLGVYLHSLHEDSLNLWSCRVAVRVTLLPSRRGAKSFNEEFTEVFTSAVRYWGFQFMEWDDIFKNCVKDDSITVEVQIILGVPSDDYSGSS